MTSHLDNGPNDTETGRALFVHDFTPVAVSFPVAAARLSTSLRSERIARSVIDACRRERVDPGLTADEGEANDVQGEVEVEVEVSLGQPRWRADAVIVPMTWRFQPEVGIPLEADLELAAYTASRCHLHLLGRVSLHPGMRPATRQSSLHGRRSVAVVRHVLDGLAQLLAGPEYELGLAAPDIDHPRPNQPRRTDGG